MTYQDTSGIAFASIMSVLQTRELQVLNAMDGLQDDWSNAEIADRLRMLPHQITGRTNSLVKKGLIERVEEIRPCRITGNSCHPYRIVPKQKPIWQS